MSAGGVYFVPAFGGLLAPHWRDDARGIVVGMTQGTSKQHLARAVLESIAFQTLDVLEAVRGDSQIQVDRLRVDGGATKNDLLMQIQVRCSRCMVTAYSSVCTAVPTMREQLSLSEGGLAVFAACHDMLYATRTKQIWF